MRLFNLILVPIMSVVACGGGRSVTAPEPSSQVPTPPPTPTAPGHWTASGVVTEWTTHGERPLADVNVNAWIETVGYGYSYWYLNGRRTTDAQGRYQLTGLPAGGAFQLEVSKDGYAAQCAAPPVVVTSDFQLDARLMPRASLSVAPSSVPPSVPGFRLISGVVYQSAAEGREPVADASVDYEPSFDSPAAWTWTDAQGRFLLCGIPQTLTITISAGSNGRVAYLHVPAGGDATVEIDLQ
jgi:hypothetical protein